MHVSCMRDQQNEHRLVKGAAVKLLDRFSLLLCQWLSQTGACSGVKHWSHVHIFHGFGCYRRYIHLVDHQGCTAVPQLYPSTLEPVLPR